MSLGARITLGIVSLLCAIGFIFVAAANASTHPLGVYCIAAFCALIALACFVPACRQVAVRLIGVTVFAVCVAYLVSQVNGPLWTSRRSQPSLLNALAAFVVFGLPGAYVAIRGIYPSWGKGAGAFLPDRGAIDQESSSETELEWEDEENQEDEDCSRRNRNG